MTPVDTEKKPAAFDRARLEGYRLPIEGATGKEFWEFKAPTIRDEIAMNGKIRALPKEEQGAYYNYMILELVYSFKKAGIPAPESPTEDPTDERFVPIVKSGDADSLYEQISALPLKLAYHLWRSVKNVVPTWGPRNESDESF